MKQFPVACGADIAALVESDRKRWLALSMPVKGVRFDTRMLELMDTDRDGRIRTPEVIAAIEFLKAKGVDFDSLFTKSEEDGKRLASVLARQADLAKVEPSADEKKAMADWEARGASSEVAAFGDATAAAESALAAVEPLIDGFFTPPEDMPLVTEEPDKTLPLRERLNPKYAEAIGDFAEKCVSPVLGEVASLDRVGWKKVKSALAPYRAWVASKPVMNAGALAALEDEERLCRYRTGFVEFLENFVNMRRLYDLSGTAVFQTGALSIDSRTLHLCFHVEDEGAHSALAAKSNCCLLYVKLSRPSEGVSRSICAVVTAGRTASLYAGRNGVFYDRDGKDWEAVVTKVVEAEVSLVEAFWAPWRKVGEAFGSMVKKILGEKQTAVEASAVGGVQNAQAGGAALASSVAAIGIGIGMMGAALASLLAAIKGMGAGQIFLSVCAVIAIVSLPSVILTWFRLRQRDLGVILNASGWAINRPLYFSMKRARAFTVCPATPAWFQWLAAIVLWTIAVLLWIA